MTRRGFLKEEDIMSKGINLWLTGELSVDDVYPFTYLCVCLLTYFYPHFYFSNTQSYRLLRQI